MWRTFPLYLTQIVLLVLVWRFGLFLGHELPLPRVSRQQSFYEVTNTHDQPPNLE